MAYDASWDNAAYEYLKTHSTAYSFTVKIGDSVYREGFFDNVDSLRDAQARYYRSIGWKPVRFWQFWRWGDTKPSKEVSDRMKESQ